MKRKVYNIATLILDVVLTACGKSKSPSNEQQAADSYDNSVIETAPVYVDSLKKDSSANASPKAKISVTPTDSNDDGYLDGLKKTVWLESLGCRWAWMMRMRTMKMDSMTAMRNNQYN